MISVKKNIKKLFAITAMLLATTMAVPAASVYATVPNEMTSPSNQFVKNNVSIYGKSNLSLSLDGKSLFDDMISSRIHINEFRIHDDNRVYLDALVYVDNEERKLKIVGEVLITENGEHIIFNAQDTENNFDIAYFALESISTKTDLFVTSLEDFSTYDYALKLYLFKKDSREISMFEFCIQGDSITRFINFEDLSTVTNSVIVWFVHWSEPIYEIMIHPENKGIDLDSVIFLPTDRKHHEPYMRADRRFALKQLNRQIHTLETSHTIPIRLIGDK